MRISDWSSDVCSSDLANRNFRIFSPDETTSNRWNDVLTVTDRMYVAERLPTDTHVSPDGRVLEGSGERRGGKECARMGRSRWSPLTDNKEQQHDVRTARNQRSPTTCTVPSLWT